MKVHKAAEVWIGYHEIHSKKNTASRYKIFIDRPCHGFGNDDINQISLDDVLTFLNRQTEGCKPNTKQIRYICWCPFKAFLSLRHPSIF